MYWNKAQVTMTIPFEHGAVVARYKAKDGRRLHLGRFCSYGFQNRFSSLFWHMNKREMWGKPTVVSVNLFRVPVKKRPEYSGFLRRWRVGTGSRYGLTILGSISVLSGGNFHRIFPDIELDCGEGVWVVPKLRRTTDGAWQKEALRRSRL